MSATAPSALARRVGPGIVVGSLLVLVAVLTWFAMTPTAIAGDITEAPFTVPATIVLPPDADGCVDLVAGDGDVTTHCIDDLATERGRGDGYEWIEVGFASDGTIEAFREGPDVRIMLWIDPATGEVLEREEFALGEEERFDRERFGEEREPGFGEGIDEPVAIEVYPDGDLVRQFDPDGYRPGEEPEDDLVVLDLDGPPGYQLRDAAMSPDGDWVVATTPDDRVIVAPADGSAAPYVWTELDNDDWVDLRRAIHWTD